MIKYDTKLITVTKEVRIILVCTKGRQKES